MGRVFISVFFFLSAYISFSQPARQHDLQFDSLAQVWDEGIPLGNATLGALIWEKDGELRFSLDRSDLWDLRDMKGLHGPHFSYQWIYEQVKKKEYREVQQRLDEPYEKEAAPSKIPGAALQFDTKEWGAVESVHLDIKTAVCTIKWKKGMVLETFIHASQPAGWFRISNLADTLKARLVPPAYSSNVNSGAGSVEGDDLNRLGYRQGEVSRKGNDISYIQEGWGGFKYHVAVSYRYKTKNKIEGSWSISSHYPDKPMQEASEIVKNLLGKNYDAELSTHTNWWKTFWSKSSLKIPVDHLEKQWYLEQYKFGSAARENAPPISLQAVWTADNGRLPPWKGDYHHDLNTQLSYWPSYSGNHLQEGMGYYHHLDSNRNIYLNYTKTFFGKEGLNVPGVTTLEGKEMGGWIQYSGSPTISSWLAHNYYLQWRYSMDKQFLVDHAYPWISQSAKFIENITSPGANGWRQLPLSSSPEIFNNNLEAWFTENTNYDLSLMKFVVGAAAELAAELGKTNEAAHWKSLLSQFGPYHLNKKQELMFAANKPYDESHRHFSHSMAIHPLGLIKWEDGDSARTIIRNSIKALDNVGPGLWTGYSYSWLANIKARAKDGEGAAKALDIFAKAFCLKNSFHVNGDQTKSGLSTFTYRPFTLEGNFAYASGLQEMLLQSYAGFIEIFPAVPANWKDVSFNTLRTEGAFLVSAKKVSGAVKNVTIFSEQGGKARVKLPFNKWKVVSRKNAGAPVVKDEMMEIDFSKGGTIALENATN